MKINSKRTVVATKYFTDYALKNWNIDANTEFNIDFINPQILLTPDRFDLICKLYYIDCREKNRNLDYARDLYIEHIRAFSGGSFIEPGSVHKNSIGKYLEDFNTLIDNIKERGIDPEKSAVPVNEYNVILDGSHRTAIAIYFNLQLPVIHLGKIECHYDFDFFRRQGMPEEYLDFLTYRYLYYKDNIYVVCLWPKADDNQLRYKVEKLIKEKASIIYKKNIPFNYHGIEHLMIHLYGNQPWCGTIDDAFSGIDEKARNCFKDNVDTLIYVIDSVSLNQVVELKNQIRMIFNIENHSIHITDTHQEAIEAGQILFNKNSIDVLNYGDPFTNKELLKNLLKKKSNNTSNYEPIFINQMPTLFGLSAISATVDSETPIDVPVCLDNPEFYLYYLGIKFASVELLEKIYSDEESLKKIAIIKKRIKNKKSNGSKENIVNKKQTKKSFKKTYLGRKLLAYYRHKRYRTTSNIGKNIEDLEKIFWNLDDNCSYLIMRNWEGFYDDILIEGHNDIDLLCGDTFSRDTIVSALGAKKITLDGFHYSFLYQGREVTLDTRIAGDGYYDKNWQLNMLENRKRHPLGFYIMDNENYLYSLAYHAIYQKKKGLSEEYLNRIRQMNPSETYESQDQLITKLHAFMKKRGYSYTVTMDKSVVKEFTRVPDKKSIKYPLEIRWKHSYDSFLAKDYKTRIKIRIRRLIIK